MEKQKNQPLKEWFIEAIEAVARYSQDKALPDPTGIQKNVRNMNQIRCLGCGKLGGLVDKYTFGFIQKKCENTRCGTISTYFYCLGKTFSVNKKLLKKKHLMAEIKVLSPKTHQAILELVNDS